AFIAVVKYGGCQIWRLPNVRDRRLGVTPNGRAKRSPNPAAAASRGVFMAIATQSAAPTREDFAKMLEESFTQGSPQEGSVVKGTVVGIEKDLAVIDVGAKTEGRVALREFAGQGRQSEIKVGNIVVSRRTVLEETRAEQRQELVQNLEEGQVIDGVVKNITDYGAFVDLGGIDGLLHVTDIAWRRVNHPTEVLNIGQQVRVKII